MQSELERLLRFHVPAGVEVELESHTATPSLFAADLPAIQIAREAIDRASGMKTALIRSGGSIPVVADFAEAGIPIGFVTMPMGGSTTPITMAGSLVVGIAAWAGFAFWLHGVTIGVRPFG